MNLSQANRLAEMALDMTEQPDLAHTLDRILLNARSSIPCDAAGVVLISENGQVKTAVASPEALYRADELQDSFREGPWPVAGSPCDYGPGGHAQLVSDTGRDDRFPLWTARLAELGFGAVLSIHLFSPLRTLGALNLCAYAPLGFDESDLELAEIFGRHASVALMSAQFRHSLRAAVDSRHVIGQAQGILMERYQVDADRAFEVLRRYSQHKNIKLRVIAEQVITEHRLPD
jgi:GAF domain-containing protein